MCCLSKQRAHAVNLEAAGRAHYTVKEQYICNAVVFTIGHNIAVVMSEVNSVNLVVVVYKPRYKGVAV